jgi:hypothetical protein
MGKIVNPQIVIVKGGETPTPPTTGDYFVKVIDFDGTVLKSANLNNGDTFELPTPPSHDGLVFQEWSSSQAITDNKITINNNNVMIGAVYTTASGLSEFDIELTAVTGLSVTLNMDGTKNWGDGTSDTATTHTYSAVGNYTITCNGTTMNTYYGSGLFGQSQTVLNYYCKNARFASVTLIRDFALSFCYSLSNVVIPSGVTSISDGVFRECYSLSNVVIPSGVTSIGSDAFTQCYSIIEYDFSTFTSVPTLPSTLAFEGINHICKMKIPSALIDEWKTATNWATYADYMVAV